MNDRIIEGGILLVAFLTLLGGFCAFMLKQISRTEGRLGDKIDRNRDQVDDDLANIRGEIAQTRTWSEQELNIMRREVGESIAAIRQKGHDVEKYGLETYVRREEFNSAVNRIETTVRDGMKDLKEDLKEDLKDLRETLKIEKGRRSS